MVWRVGVVGVGGVGESRVFEMQCDVIRDSFCGTSFALKNMKMKWNRPLACASFFLPRTSVGLWWVATMPVAHGMRGNGTHAAAQKTCFSPVGDPPSPCRVALTFR